MLLDLYVFVCSMVGAFYIGKGIGKGIGILIIKMIEKFR